MRINNFLKNNIAILAIIFIGLFLRTLFIDSSPPSLYGDELTITLDANSLLKTGRDQLGNFLPLTFPMGAGRPAGYVYGSIPFVAVFGPTALGVRALSILSGIGIILLLYFLGKRFFSKKVGLIAAFLGAISPWDISLSRGGFEAHFALFLALLGAYLFIKAKENPKFYIFSALSFGLAIHTYPTYKVSLLLFIPLSFWLQRVNFSLPRGKQYFLSGLIILLIFGLLALSQTFFGGSELRFTNINIFSQDSLKSSIEQKINLERTQTRLPESLVKYFHNRQVEYSKIFIENYLQNFSLDFLTLHGDRNPRHNMATMGEIYLIDVPLIFIGILGFWHKQKKIIIFLVFWILLSPVATAVIDLPHALRSSFMLPPIILLSALGLVVVLNSRKKIFFLIIAGFFIIQFLFFAQKLYFLSPVEYSYFWSYPARLASEIAQQNRNDYKYIFLSDRIDGIEFAYPVYAKVDPLTVIYQNQTKMTMQNLSFKKFDNIYIGNIPDGNIQKFIEELDGTSLYIGIPDDLKYLKNYETVNGINNFSTLVIMKHSI